MRHLWVGHISWEGKEGKQICSSWGAQSGPVSTIAELVLSVFFQLRVWSSTTFQRAWGNSWLGVVRASMYRTRRRVCGTNTSV